jgi:hypothetical protein
MKSWTFNIAVLIAVLTAATDGTIAWPGVLVSPENIVQLQKVLEAILSVWAIALPFMLKAGEIAPPSNREE